MSSLRWRLIGAILAGIALVFAGGGWIAYSAIGGHLYKEFDAGLLARAKSMATYVELDHDGLTVEWLEKADELPIAREATLTLFQVWSESGEVLSVSPELAENSLPSFGGSFDAPAFRHIDLPGGIYGRGVSVGFEAIVDREDVGPEVPAPNVLLTVAREDSVAPVLADLRGLFLALWLGCSLLAGLVVWLVVRGTMSPLDSLRRQIGELREPSATQRIALQNPPAELVPVIGELNGLLDRLESAIVRERNLTSNVAHELRTPIAGMLSTLEVMLSRPRGADEYRAAGEESFEIAKQMHWLVNNLLSMSRIEAGEVHLHYQGVDLEPALREWWEPFAARARERDIAVRWEVAAGAKLETDPEFLRVVVSNLYDNAVSYTPAGGTVAIRADPGGDIVVENDAVEVSQESAARAFEPFWRGDEARENVGVHAGLGMALCGKIVALLGGSIRAAAPSGDRFEVTVSLAAA